MSEVPFEQFLLQRLKTLLRDRITAGQRFQFRSPDFDNTSSLQRQAEAVAEGHVQLGDVTLPWFDVGSVRLICVAHSEGTNDDSIGFNENYIAMLRDKVAAQVAPLSKVRCSLCTTACSTHC